jgi:hypothetical protein
MEELQAELNKYKSTTDLTGHLKKVTFASYCSHLTPPRSRTVASNLPATVLLQHTWWKGAQAVLAISKFSMLSGITARAKFVQQLQIGQ